MRRFIQVRTPSVGRYVLLAGATDVCRSATAYRRSGATQQILPTDTYFRVSAALELDGDATWGEAARESWAGGRPVHADLPRPRTVTTPRSAPGPARHRLRNPVSIRISPKACFREVLSRRLERTASRLRTAPRYARRGGPLAPAACRRPIPNYTESRFDEMTLTNSIAQRTPRAGLVTHIGHGTEHHSCGDRSVQNFNAWRGRTPQAIRYVM